MQFCSVEDKWLLIEHPRKLKFLDLKMEVKYLLSKERRTIVLVLENGFCQTVKRLVLVLQNCSCYGLVKCKLKN